MKTSLIEKAKRIIDERRFNAESHAQENKSLALKNEDFKKVYHNYVDSMINDAKHGQTASEKTLTLEKKYKEFLNNKKIGSITPLYTCEKCNDNGYFEGKYCDCFIKELNNLLKLESGFLVLEDFDNANFELFKNKTQMALLYQKMKKWCYSDFDKTLILIAGHTGVGKTHLMKCMANELIKRNKLVLLTTSFAMHQDFAKSFSTRDQNEKNTLIEKYIETDILFIDDLGTELRSNENKTNYLYCILNERITNKKPTVITSNLTLEDIMEYYDERISSRIADKSTSICIYLQGEDIRLK